MTDTGTRSGSAWATVAVGVGFGALMLAFVPYYVGVVGAVAGVAGLTVGLVGLLRRADDSPALASVGMAVSALAIVAGIVMTLIHTKPAPEYKPAVASPTKTEDRSDTATVMDHELTVTIGDYQPGFLYGQLPVTLTSRLDKARAFTVVVAAFDGDEQLAADTVRVTLNARESKQEKTLATSDPENASEHLKGATFRVIAASSTPVKK